MKKNRVIQTAILFIFTAIILASCGDLMTTTTIMQRLDQLATDLNAADRSNAYLNFDPTQTEYYAAIRDAAALDTPFPTVGPLEQQYSFANVDYANPENVTADMYGPPLFSGTGDPRPAVLVMSKVGTDWMIHEIYLDGSSTATIKNLK